MRTILDGILQGLNGSTRVDRPTEPTVAECSVGPFSFLAGDPHNVAAEQHVRSLGAGSVLLLPDACWRDTVRRAIGNRIHLEPRMSYSCQKLDPTHLRNLQSTRADTEVIRLDARKLDRAVRDVSPALQRPEVFASGRDFEERGIGYGALHSGRLVAGAVSGYLSSAGIEIQINTHPDYRRQGFARAVAIPLILECLERGLEPSWDSSNPASQQLAEQLGYVRRGSYEWWIVQAR